MTDPLEYAYGATAYAAYNATPGIDGKNFRGEPSPAFPELPAQIQRGWGRASLHAAGLTYGTFGWALAQLEAGSKVARAHWGGYWQRERVLVLIAPPRDEFPISLTLAYLQDGGVAPAQPYWADLLATDWKTVE